MYWILVMFMVILIAMFLKTWVMHLETLNERAIKKCPKCSNKVTLTVTGNKYIYRCPECGYKKTVRPREF